MSSRLEIVSFTPRYWRSAPASAIQSPPAIIPATAIASLTASGGAPRQQMPGDGGGEPAEHERAFAADHDQPGLRGQRDAERGEDSGAARCSVFCQENALANPPR